MNAEHMLKIFVVTILSNFCCLSLLFHLKFGAVPLRRHGFPIYRLRNTLGKRSTANLLRCSSKMFNVIHTFFSSDSGSSSFIVVSLPHLCSRREHLLMPLRNVI